MNEGIPEFDDDAESLFVNWDYSKDNNSESDGGSGVASSSKDWNQILDAADATNNVVDNRRTAEKKQQAAANESRPKDDGRSAASSEGEGNTTSSATATSAPSSSSNSNNNFFTFPMYYQMNQGHIHPLAMTSMASCPPYVNASSTTTTNTTAATVAPQQSPALNVAAMLSTTIEGLMRQSHKPQHQPPQQSRHHQPLPTTGAAASTFAPGSNNNNTAAPSSSTFSYNSPYSTHLSELTANFRNNPTANAHYGMAVNGFHPQVNAQVNPVMPLSSNGVIGACGTAAAAASLAAAAFAGVAVGSSGTIKTSNKSRIGGGGGRNSNKHNVSSSSAIPPTITSSAAAAATTSTHTRNSRERNEREQVRAQKITQLISELRVNMQNGGWQEEMKSKYQTLSQCKEYVEFLMRSHKEKEADIEHTKKLVEEKVLFEARSGHLSDSVTSSLTAFTTRSSDSSDKDSSSSSECQEPKDRKKRKKNDDDEKDGDGEGPTNKDDDNVVPKSPSKKERRSSRRKRKLEEAQRQQSSTDSSSDYDEGDESPGGKNISFSNKTSSSVSDMTDSNKSCTTNNNTKGSTGSISSTAAVVRGVGSSQNTPSHHNKCRRNSHRQSPRRKVGSSSMDAVQEEPPVKEEAVATGKPSHKKKRTGYDYDYREVFLKSNVPQLIATLSGRIVVWNDFFLQATGLNKRDIGRLTIFSIVQSSQLSTLYKMVARALAEQHVAPTGTSPSEKTSAIRTSSEEDTASPKPSNSEDWQVVTLRCVRFPSSKDSSNQVKDEDKDHPLFLTVTLMGDANRDQRCFHCTLTDTPTDEGQFGNVTPEFLAKMFAPAAITAGAGKGS